MAKMSLFLAVCVLCLSSCVWAFNGHRVTEGPLTVTIEPVAMMTEYNQVQPVLVTCANRGDQALNITLKLGGLVDQWKAFDQTVQSITVPAGQSSQATFQIVAGEGVYSALYPVHIDAGFSYGGTPASIHAVQIVETRFPTANQQFGAELSPITVLPQEGAEPLCSLKNQQVSWHFFDKPTVTMPLGWRGSAPDSRASFSIHPISRGATKQSLDMHPAWYGGAGTIFAGYRLKLPATKPIQLVFANAIRDNGATEPASDGVTFRVWVDDEKIFERHTDSKVWLDGQVDLNRFAGREITLRLENHPGPKRDTTCDSSFWGEPTILVGRLPERLSPADRDQMKQQARQLLKSTRPQAQKSTFIPLENGNSVAVIPGPNGLMDAQIALGNAGRNVVFDGIRISILGDTVGQDRSPILVRSVTSKQQGRRYQWVHHLLSQDRQLELTLTLWPEKSGLRIAVECPERITDFALGPADRTANRVYYGHGYCMENPGAFRAGYGGHNLSTSHVGFDFDGGVSLLAAVDNPPDYLEVTPAEKIYTLHTHMNATMTLVPGTDGIFDCAIRYRPLYDKKPSPGYTRKAGRFVFDIWGGRYDDNARIMQQMVDYGLTDSLLTLHVWQRWGYDYRLPDIFPPNPQLGTVDDMRQVARVCEPHDIPWGLHDNYIDFYPDAEDYTYKAICFTDSGQPIKAWLNEGRDAQSYRWRPDCIMPFVQRNLKPIKDELGPTHYFIDVFTSIDCFDFYDDQGRFHPMLETRQYWGEAFRWIQDTLGNNAVTTSEAGDDLLVGYLDGADCQFLQLTKEPREFCLTVKCDDWERTPWFDAVLHDRFSLHGVGYSGRYEGGRSRVDHGIESDDYISAELLTGHALMMDRGGFGRGAVRKYWLAQDFVRSIAQTTIQQVEYVDNDIHRQIIRWAPDAVVYVNRGDTDWNVAGKVLPPFGYYARNGAIESSIERLEDIIVERSSGPDGFYVNGRGEGVDNRLQVQPVASGVDYRGNRLFDLTVDWEINRPIQKDLSIFLHFLDSQSSRSDKIVFQGDMRPAVGISQWSIGKVSTGGDRSIRIPDTLGPGEYDIVIGLWDPANGRRYPMQGDDIDSQRYLLGKLVVEGEGQTISNVRLVKHAPRPQTPSRWNVAGQAIDFGAIQTAGSMRCQRRGDGFILMPLPGSEPFSVTLALNKLSRNDVRKDWTLSAVDRAGKVIRPVDYQMVAGKLTFTTVKDEFGYQLR